MEKTKKKKANIRDTLVYSQARKYMACLVSSLLAHNYETNARGPRQASDRTFEMVNCPSNACSTAVTSVKLVLQYLFAYWKKL